MTLSEAGTLNEQHHLIDFLHCLAFGSQHDVWVDNVNEYKSRVITCPVLGRHPCLYYCSEVYHLL